MPLLFARAAAALTKTTFFTKSVRAFSRTAFRFREMNNPAIDEQQKAVVDGLNINYVQVGNGPHPVLLLPGALGSIWTDFKPQIEQLNRKELTIVAWDPPGCGNSRPPDREFSVDFYEKDAVYAHDLMQKLGFSKYSLLGWSDGGNTSMIIAAMYPKMIQKLVIFGTNSFILPEEMKLYEGIRNIDNWSDRMKAPKLKVYGELYFKNLCSAWVDGMKLIFEQKNGDICKGHLDKIQCPTLIIHGKKDVAVHQSHPVYLNEHIRNSELVFFEEGGHNLHLRYPEKFNKLVEDFLLK